MPKCYDEANRFDFNVDMNSANRNLNACINKVMEKQLERSRQQGWESEIDLCVTNFERHITGSMDDEIDRILKL